MTEQQGPRPSDKDGSPGGNYQDVSSHEPRHRNRAQTHSKAEEPEQVEQVESGVSAQTIWRLIIVGFFVLLGMAVGYQVGVFVTGFAEYAADNAPGTFAASFGNTIRNLHAELPDRGMFLVLGGLIAYLAGSWGFNKLSVVAENLQSMRANEKIALIAGVITGLVITVLLRQLLYPFGLFGLLLTFFLGVLSIFLCTAGALSMKESIRLPRGGGHDGEFAPSAAGESTSNQIKILDTNVIIDGRVSDVCRTGFIEGTIYVPGFVLDELQHIADSADSLKRARGRRGLDILNQMRSELSLLVRTLDAKADLAPNEEVDSKLVKLAKKLGGAIVTNDFNLNKVAELQGVPVLNINELANALKPVVLPGEEMSVAVIKEGKEMNQGIGYLDDGTMIVIEGARRRIGETMEVVVSSVLQTVAGKMIFATIKLGHDDGYESEYGDGSVDTGSGSRSYPGSRPRRPFRDR